MGNAEDLAEGRAPIRASPEGTEVRHAGLNLARLLVALGLGVVISVLLARGLGPERRGIYALAALLPFALDRVLAMGLGPTAAVFTARDPAGGGAVRRRTLALAWRLGLCAATVGGVVAFSLGERLFPGVPLPLLLAGALMAPVLILSGALQGVLQGRRDFRRFNLVRLVPHTVLLDL